MRRVLLVLWAAAGLTAAGLGGYAAGHRAGREEGYRRGAAEEINWLIRVGFTVTDPDGFEVERFDADA